MTTSPYFSDHTEARRPVDGLVREAVPPRVRNHIANLLETWRDDSSYNEYECTSGIWTWAVYQLDLPADSLSSYARDNHLALRTSIERGEWMDVLDLLTAMFTFLGKFGSRFPHLPQPEAFRVRVNASLVRHYSAYQMDEDGRVVEPGSHAAEEVIAEARALLVDPRFAGPDRQYQNALLAFSRRPEPDCELAVSQALNALEGVARIVLGKPTATLGDAAKDIAREKGLHGALAESIGKLYGYASGPAGRHGLVGDSKVDRPIAEYCLHQAAAAIVLLARLYGHDVIEGASARGTKPESR